MNLRPIVSPTLREALSHTLLTATQTETLVKLAKKGDKDAETSLVVHNQRLIYKIAMHYFASGATGDAPIEDLMQEGLLGFYQAIAKFKNNKGSKFTTYASWWIRQRIRRYGIRGGMRISLSYRTTERRSIAIHSRERLTKKLGREPGIGEIMRDTHLSKEVVESIGIQIISTDQQEESCSGRPIEIIDTQADAVHVQVETKEDIAFLAEALDCLTRQERRVINSFYGIGAEPATMPVIAKRMKLNVSEVKNIKNRALLKMRMFAEL